MDKLGEVYALVDTAAESQFMGSPVDGLGGGRSPNVALLEVFEKWRAVGGMSDGGLVIVGDGALGNLELCPGMGKEKDVGARASVLVLEFSGGSVGVNVELGRKG